MVCILNVCFIESICSAFTITLGVIRIIAEIGINSYYAQGKANATVNKILIGSHTASINTTSCSFNCKSIQGWQSLTSDNFSFVPTGGYMHFKCSDELRIQADRGGNVSISYNNSTGVVTVSGLEFGVQTYSDVYSWVCLSGNVYCYVVSD